MNASNTHRTPAADKTLVITTGGTIEALYDPRQGTPYHVPLPDTKEESAIPEALRQLGVSEPCDVVHYSMHDSKKMSLDSMKDLLRLMGEHPHRKVVIVHGTDTMPRNAQYMQRILEKWDGGLHNVTEKSIIFTGAMGPLRDAQGAFRPRDALKNDGWENLANAVSRVQHLPPDVYMEMGLEPKRAVNAHEADKHVETESDQPGTQVKHSEFVRKAFDPDDHVNHRF